MLLSNIVLSQSVCPQLLGWGPSFRLSKACTSYTLAYLVSSPDSTLTESSPISMPLPGPTQTAQPRLVGPIWAFPNFQVQDKWHILFVRELCDLHIRHTNYKKFSCADLIIITRLKKDTMSFICTNPIEIFSTENYQDELGGGELLKNNNNKLHQIIQGI